MTKIEYNSEFSNSSINHLNNCIGYLKDVNNILCNINYPYGFGHSGTLNNLRGNLSSIKEDIVDYKDDISKCMEDINRNELDLLSKINGVEDIQIKNFDFEVTWR